MDKLLSCHCGTLLSYKVVGQHGAYTIVQCVRCQTLRTLQVQADPTTFYTQDEQYHAVQQITEGKPPYQERFEHDYSLACYHRLPKYLKQLRFLDVGCANGAFVAAMKDIGFDAHGLEINPQMAEFASAQSGCPIYTNWSQVTGKFDVITYHDVFEHVESPPDELARVFRALRPQGLLVLDVPDAGCTEAAFMDWKHWRPEQHLWHWTAQTLHACVARGGFIMEAVDRPIPGKLVLYARRN